MESKTMIPTLEQVKQAARKFSSNATLANPDEKALHTYTDTAGNPLYWRIRLKNTGTGEKWIRPFHHDGEQFQSGEPPKPEAGKPLYNMHLLAKYPDALVWIVEGEKAADALNKAFKEWAADMQHVATTSGGATSANAADWQPLVGRRVVVWPDNDLPDPKTGKINGAMYAAEACECLQGIAASALTLDISGLNLPEKGDAFDWLQQPDASIDAFLALVEAAQDAPQGDEASEVIPSQGGASESPAKPLSKAEVDELLKKLAGMEWMEYENARKSYAEQLGVREMALDKAVALERKKGKQEEFCVVVDTEPHPYPVNPGEVLNELRAAFKRHAILPDHADVALTLWAVMTWFIDALRISPLLVIRSPESGCGKSTVKDTVELFVQRPLSADSVSHAALFRVVEVYRPTLLMDEVDTWLTDPKDERHGLINSGHKRGGIVLRCVGDNHEVKPFSTWCPKVLAFIGKTKDTLHNRSIEIVLRRKLASETIQNLRNADHSSYDVLREKLARLAADNMTTIEQARPDIPVELENRKADNWEPLFAIADLAAGAWPELARKAAIALNSATDATVSIGVELLADIQAIFETKHVDRISTADLIAALCEDDEAAWAHYNHGKPITGRQVTKRLSEYGIKAAPMRAGYEVSRGYRKDQFADAFSRYLSAPPENSVTTLQPSTGAGFGVTNTETVTVTQTPFVTRKPSTDAGCNNVTDKTGEKADAEYI